jgi:hypothetical protein
MYSQCSEFYGLLSCILGGVRRGGGGGLVARFCRTSGCCASLDIQSWVLQQAGDFES